jgi:hypothetical protein
MSTSATQKIWRGNKHAGRGDLGTRIRDKDGHVPSMYADEKSDEAVVPTKRPNKGRQLPAEAVEGRASPKGNSRQAAWFGH